MSHKLGLPDRFWTKVTRRPDGTGCWDWVGAVNASGYGCIGVGSMKDGTRGTRLAHRLILEAKLGRPPDPGMDTIHSCDRPCCVNPDHLSEGTRATNVAECVSRMRHARGERHGQRRLSDDAIRAIREDTRSQREIADCYGVGSSVISEIKSRKAWRHVP